MGTSIKRFENFQATNWINNETPLNATNMNRIEESIANIVQILKEYEDNALGSQTLNTVIADAEDGSVSKNSAQGVYSTAAGLGTVATNRAEFVVGKYNASFDESSIGIFGHPLFTIGCGTGDTDNERKSLLVATDKGHIITSGTLHTKIISVNEGLTISSGSGAPAVQLTTNGVFADKAEIDNIKSNIVEATEKIYGPSYDFEGLNDDNKGKLLVNYETFNALKSVVDKFFDVVNIDNVENFVDTLKEIQEEFKSLATVAKSGNYEDLENTPDTLPNPNKLTIKRGTSTLGTYDGSEAKSINIASKKLTIKQGSATLGTYDGASATTVTLPNELPNPNKLTITQNGTTLGEYDGSGALTIDIPESGGNTSTEIVEGWFPMEVGDTITKFKWLGVEELAYPVNESGEQMLGFTDSIANNGTFTLYDDAMMEDGSPGSGRWYQAYLGAGVWGGDHSLFMETYSPYDEWEFDIIGNSNFGWMDSPESVGVAYITITSIADWAKPYLQVYKTMEVEVEKPELFYAEQEQYNSATKKPNGIYFTTDTHKIYVGEDDFSNPLVKNEDGELTPLHASNKEFQEHVDEFNSYKTQVTEDIKAVETQLDYIKNTPGVKPLPDSSNDLLQLPIGNYTCLSSQGQSVYMDYWDEEIQGSNSIYYELEYGNTVSIYKYLDGADAENDAICYKIRTFKEHVDVKTDLYRNEVKSIEVNELEHFYSIDHLDLTISEVEQIVRECHTNHKPLVIVKGRMRYLCNQVHLLGTDDRYLVFIFTNYDGNGLATVYRNQYLRDTTSSDRSILATAEQTPYTIQFTKGTPTDAPK